MGLYVGTSSWTKPAWAGTFYPAGLRAPERLPFYARHFSAVEVDASFYGAPLPTTVDQWAGTTPPTFRFALKVPRAITHDRLLAGCAPELLEFLALARRLGGHLGPVILQLPPRFARPNLPDLFQLVEALPPQHGLTVEFRDPSCFTPECVERLGRGEVGLVTTDRHSGLMISGPDVVLRLLGDRDAMPSSGRLVQDRGAELEVWATRLRALPVSVRDAYAFASDHFAGHAPATAADLTARLGLLPPAAPPEPQGRLFG